MYLTPSDPEIEPVHQNEHKSVKVILHKKKNPNQRHP